MAAETRAAAWAAWARCALRDRRDGSASCGMAAEVIDREEDWADGGADAGEFFDVARFRDGYEAGARAVLRQQVEGARQGDAFLAKFEAEAARNWDKFYQRNTTNFFKDRHYLLKDFPLLAAHLRSGAPCDLLEVGCGVGNTILPLAKQFERLNAFGLDFARKAVDLLNEQAVPRCQGFECDVSRSPVPGDQGGVIPTAVPQVDFATMMFVLSAVAPERMEQVVENVLSKLKPGGLLLFRDYAELDQAQLRFDPDQRLGHNYYVRQDGTRSFFFTLEGLAWLFERQCGLERIETRLIRRVVLNRAAGMRMRRVFAHAVFRRPMSLT